MPTSACVTSGRPLYMFRAITTLVLWRAHSGQRMPTDVGVMHAGQMGRPQLEHETPVSRLGCR